MHASCATSAGSGSLIAICGIPHDGKYRCRGCQSSTSWAKSSFYTHCNDCAGAQRLLDDADWTPRAKRRCNTVATAQHVQDVDMLAPCVAATAAATPAAAAAAASQPPATATATAAGHAARQLPSGHDDAFCAVALAGPDAAHSGPHLVDDVLPAAGDDAVPDCEMADVGRCQKLCAELASECAD